MDILSPEDTPWDSPLKLMLFSAALIEDPIERTSDLACIAQALIHADRRLEGLEILQRAIEASDDIRDLHMNQMALAEIIEVEKTARDTRTVAADLRELQVRLVKSGDVNSWQPTLFEVVKQAIKLERTTEALDAAQQIKDNQLRDAALRRIALTLANHGNATGAAEIAKQISQPADQARVLGEIADVLTTNGDAEELDSLANELLQAVRQMNDVPNKVFRLTQVAAIFHRSERQNATDIVLGEAENVTNGIRNLQQKIDARLSLAGAYIKCADHLRALAHAHLALEMLESFIEPEKRILPQIHIAETFARAGRLWEARGIIDRLPTERRIKGYRAIIRAAAYDGRISEALELTKQIEDRKTKANAIRDIADGASLHNANQAIELSRLIPFRAVRLRLLNSLAYRLATQRVTPRPITGFADLISPIKNRFSNGEKTTARSLVEAARRVC